MLESHPHGGPSELLIISSFGLSRRDIADRSEQPSIVEPVNPFKRGHLNGLQVAPRPTLLDDLCLVQSVDRLGQRVVVRIAHAADRRFDASFSQPVRVTDRHVLHAAVTVMDQAGYCHIAGMLPEMPRQLRV